MSEATKTRYAQVGLGVRFWIYSIAVVNRYADRSELVGLCDTNAGRLGQRVEWASANELDVPGYDAGAFDRTLDEARPDCVIVTCPDESSHVSGGDGLLAREETSIRVAPHFTTAYNVPVQCGGQSRGRR